ncbi:hypothetical protein E2C01_056505 [Portunus trituberculatus]|uniref:Uncharacterized protein n=1 Tax=Portunus trituberculatus TaxID=210409 RepID=A0A5B7GQY8_PORTR|nr:hypothetical protein [Portunus trituberculatus]
MERDKGLEHAKPSMRKAGRSAGRSVGRLVCGQEIFIPSVGFVQGREWDGPQRRGQVGRARPLRADNNLIAERKSLDKHQTTRDVKSNDMTVFAPIPGQPPWTDPLTRV